MENEEIKNNTNPEQAPEAASQEQNLSFQNRIDLSELQQSVEKLKAELAKVIVGQQDFIELLIVSLLSNGHVLIEGVPGIAKTVTAKLFAKTLKTDFNRIQFTPDLMPSDVLGTSVLNMKTSDFEFKKGPIFSNMVLIDEINRAPAKTQAALFEVMEERQVTIDGIRYPMDPPFMVLATQNPVEQEGTYALPEAQLDRFLFKIKVDYPTFEDEVNILKTHHERKTAKPLEMVDPVITPKQLLEFKAKTQDVIIEEKILGYIAEIVTKTRTHPHLYLGGSPRASIAVMNASKAFAAINGRDFVTPEDIKKSLFPVLRHRLILSPEREMEGMTTENVIEMILQSVEIPR
ncbi:MoxR-like ATPase [Aquimarina sp. EL_43]|uniref:AAA family ATPase n=1 Tax=unclassified Aquimarina TaxID=2627091 RepID=UPI0018C93EDA|nr:MULTISPECIES: MoxR family ATPase [unclassified Aquimarina]MBG6129100.1 MoxR-like ATPase [Aquimarina sp. EL_35]MBG6150165.1 MoxR-like ATPase [Aquimarina sp. EL_32]MBG6167150.1 MoxR-like ATPase [Aquimarina sp. EL_43]